MKILDVPFTAIDWDNVDPVTYRGETGYAVWKTVETGNVRVRMVEYSPGYSADHWCSRGHVILVLEGEMTTELKDGRKFFHSAGVVYQMSDDIAPHRSSTEKGVKLFIVD